MKSIDDVSKRNLLNGLLNSKNNRVLVRFFSIYIILMLLISFISFSIIPISCAESIPGKPLGDNKKIDTPDEEEEEETEEEKGGYSSVSNPTGYSGVSNPTVVDDNDDEGDVETYESNNTASTNEKNNNENIETETDDDDELTIETDLGDIIEDMVISVETPGEEKSKTSIQRVEFTSSSNQKNVTLKVSNLKEKPAEVTNELNITDTSKVYKYLDIKLTADDEYIGESGISTMKFTFTVEKAWIKNQSIDKYSIKLMRYHNDTWQELNTTYVNETEDMLYYEAFTPGLSVFAVVGNTIVEDSGAIVDGSTQVPWWISLGVIASSSTLLGIVLVKKRYIYRV